MRAMTDKNLQRKEKKSPKNTETQFANYTDHRIPESLSAFCSIVSLTAANTSRIFVVSVACVKLTKNQYWSANDIESIEGDVTYWGYTLNRALFACMNFQRMYLAALLISDPPVYSGKNRSSGTYSG